jgi:tetratricopeptide (TPR) repeat protein
MDDIPKPKLVFFRYMREALPRYILLHAQEQVRCLSHFFDVTVISRDCAYGEICEKYLPQITLFESGVYVGKRNITGTSAHQEIPKLGFLNSDAYCETRKVFISDMARWGVRTFFTLSVSMGEYVPEISKDLFAWPNFADPDVYRDYGLYKAIPILLTGSRKGHYPWRNRVDQILSQHYPSLTSPHFGWFNEDETVRMSFGEEYARMINAAWFVPTCGSIARELVRKHFESPAARAFLITQKTAATEAAGFLDGENCIYADEHDVLDKMDHLYKHRDDLEKVITAGYELAHSRHTMKQRDQIFQWFNLHRNLKPGQRIVQPNPFQPMIVVDEKSQIYNGHFIGPGLDRTLLREGDQRLWAGKYEEAEKLYLKCLNYHSMPEAKLRLALSNLYKGNAERALYWVAQPLNHTLEVYGASEPDPVEWAYFIISLLCQGKLQEAIKRANQFSSLRHTELDRVRVTVNLLDRSSDGITQLACPVEYRSSLHVLPERSFEGWADNLCGLLSACHQSELAGVVMRRISFRGGSEMSQETHKLRSGVLPGDRSKAAAARGFGATNRRENLSDVLPLKSESLFETLRRQVKPLLKVLFADPLRALEARVGYFLPYPYSAMKTDEFLSTVRQLAKSMDVKTGLVIGASAGEGSTEAFLAGMRENPNSPIVYCMNESRLQFLRLKKRHGNDGFVRCVTNLMTEGCPRMFGAVLIDGSDFNGANSAEERYRASYILLDHINTFPGHKIYQTLLNDGDYRLLARNPGHRNGYAIFQNKVSKDQSL